MFSRSVMSDSLWPLGLQHARLPCPSPSPRACLNSFPLSRWCHPTILSSVVPFSSCLQFFPASGSFPVSWLFESGGQRIGISASASVSNSSRSSRGTWEKGHWTKYKRALLQPSGQSHLRTEDLEQAPNGVDSQVLPKLRIATPRISIPFFLLVIEPCHLPVKRTHGQ